MRSLLIKSVPALAVLFFLTFGFVTFNAHLQNAEAGESSNACGYLTAQCRTESENVTVTCLIPPVNQRNCEFARQDYEEVCNNAAEACRD